jgi:hypothetical protein
MWITKFINGTQERLEVKEGNAGIYSKIASVAPGGSCNVQCDPNATYREFWVGTNSSGMVVTINSDDCAESEEITVVDRTGNIIKTPRSKPGSTAKSKSWLWPFRR